MATVLWGFAVFVVFNRDVFLSRLRSPSDANTQSNLAVCPLKLDKVENPKSSEP